MSTSNCANCKVTGLPVFPTLYAAVPSSVAPVLPDGIAGERVKAVNIEQPPPLVKNANKLIPNHATYKYGLRVARKGYLYVLYESGYKGKWQWDVYVVHGDGCIRLQPSALAIDRPQDKLACETAGHQVARTHFFVIQDPENCEQVWLAFSEHKWTAKTLAQMADQNDPSGRTKRMQPFQPKAWLSGRQSAGHAAEATESTVSQVLDYRKGMGSLLAPEHNNKKISDSTNGRYSIDVLCSQASVHPVQQRDGQSLQLVKQMQTTGKRPDGKSHPPVLFALWDAIGVVRDLKGYRDDAGGWVAVYMEKERALQVSGMSMIDGAKLAMENAAELEFRGKRSLKATAAESRWRGPEGVEALRKQGATKPPPINEHYRETADLIADWESKGVPGLYVQRLEGILRQSSLPGWTDAKTRPPLEASRTAQLHALKAEVQAYLSKHSQSGQDAVGKAREQAWPRYEKLIVRDEARLAELRKDPNIDGNKLPYPLETFRANFNAFQLDADTLIDARTVHLVKWLESSLLLDTLLTFDKDDLRSGVEFSNTVSDAIFGIGSSASGAKKLDAWVNELKADVPANLFWRAFALNHAKLETNINQALQAATNNKSKFTESEFGNALSAIDFSKGIYDVYNRAAGIVIEEEGKARAIASVAVAAAGAAGAAYTASPTSQPLSLPKQMALADRLVLTAGDRLFKLFRLDKTSDWVGEKVMLHLMNVRALVEPNESQKFIKEEVAERVKIRAKAKVQAKLAALKSGHDKQMSSVQSLKGQIPDDEYEKLVKKVRNTYASKNQEAQNRKLGHHSIGQIERQLTDEVRQDKTSPLRMAWERFQTDPVRRDEHSTLIRERRLVAIVTMLELVNLSKLIAYDIASQGKDDAKTYWSLAASGMTIAAGVADMTGLSIKYLLNDQSVSFKRLKLFSGGMAVGATWIGAFFDGVDAASEYTKGRTSMMLLYTAKALVGIGLGIVTLAASLTYATNLVPKILMNMVSTAAIENLSKRAGNLLLARLLGVAAGTWITLSLMSIQVAIIALDDNALEKWCKNSPFGLDASGNDAFKDPEKMSSSLESAIYDVK